MAAYLPAGLAGGIVRPISFIMADEYQYVPPSRVAETFIYYLCVPGIFMLLMYNRKPAVLDGHLFRLLLLVGLWALLKQIWERFIVIVMVICLSC